MSFRALRNTLALALVLLCVFHRAASAQRGERYIERELLPKSDELLGFPGLVDTHTLRTGELVADLPFFNVEYGISENLSVGSNVLVDLTSLTGSPSGHAQLRYRFYEKDGIKVVLDGMLLGLDVRIDENAEENAGQRITMGLALAGCNISRRLGPSSQLTVGGKVVRILASNEDPEAPEGFQDESTLTMVTLSLAYERRLLRWLHMQSAALVVPAISGEIDSSVASGTLDIGASIPIASRSLLRAMLSANAGHWLFSAGALGNANASYLTPWIGIARKWK